MKMQQHSNLSPGKQ